MRRPIPKSLDPVSLHILALNQPVQSSTDKPRRVETAYEMVEEWLAATTDWLGPEGDRLGRVSMQLRVAHGR